MVIFKWIKIMWRKHKLEKLGLDFSNVDMKQMMNPSLSDYELEKMESDDIPTNEEIELYFNMYLRKFYRDREDEWSVELPMSFEEFEKKAQTPTEIISEEGDTIGIMVRGGYKFMIPQTVDVFIGFPPYTIYHRYVDYEKLVKEGIR